MKIGLIGTAAIAALVVVGCGKKESAAEAEKKAEAKPAPAPSNQEDINAKIDDILAGMSL